MKKWYLKTEDGAHLGDGDGVFVVFHNLGLGGTSKCYLLTKSKPGRVRRDMVGSPYHVYFQGLEAAKGYVDLHKADHSTATCVA